MKNITFIPSSQEAADLVQSPEPASKLIPEWYKKIVPAKSNKINWHPTDVRPVLGLKNCLPFLDAMTGGYTMTTWCDLHIENDNGNIIYRYAIKPELMAIRDNVAIELSKDFYPLEFIWKNHWRAKLPKGYSVLITHPFNRLDLPFQTLSAVVDADTFYHSPIGNIPFYIKTGFEGIIPVGTPMFQIFPFKRDKWEKTESQYNEKEREKAAFIMNRFFIDAYRKQFWQKKSYT